jgi:sugar (pentulose or hexulose) kinase
LGSGVPLGTTDDEETEKLNVVRGLIIEVLGGDNLLAIVCLGLDRGGLLIMS